MMHEDQSIESVLQALRSAQPPDGMADRIQSTLLHTASEPRKRFTLPLLALASVAVLFFAAAGVFTLRHKWTTPLPQTTSTTPRPQLSPADPEVIGNQAPRTRKTGRMDQAASVRPVTAISKRRTEQPAAFVAESVPGRILPEILVHESIPEPPLPLTHQERLMLRVLHNDASVQLAEYTPDARARRLHEDAEAYRSFFASRPPLKDQPIYIQPIYHQQILGGTE